MKRISILLILFSSGWLINVNGQEVLDNYIKEGLRNNEGIKQQKFQLDKNLYALKEARSLFFPTVGFNAAYYRADGGRTVDLPIGTLLNPVYSTLNKLTGTNNFPTVQDQSILFNPDNFYDAKFHTTLPIINAEIFYNQKIRSKQVSLQQIEIDIYKRELVLQVKTAYYQYCQATASVKVYGNALALVKESERINDVLFKNQKINRTAVTRGENEISKAQAALISAQQTQKNALAYFNFLLNRPQGSAIIIDSNFRTAQLTLIDTNSISKREELRKLNIASGIAKTSIDLVHSYHIPKFSTFLDIGSQGFDWKYNNTTQYYFWGLTMDWSIFASGRNTYKTKQAQADLNVLRSQTNYTEERLQLQLTTSINSYAASLNNYKAALSQLTSAERYYNDIMKLYREGQVLYIELLDAEDQYINAQLQVNITFYDLQIKQAEVERADASYNLNN
jgi:outer membrane protein TolC